MVGKANLTLTNFRHCGEESIVKERYSPAILASYVTFKELYNEGKYRSPYQILAEFIKYIILTENAYSFSLFDMKNHLKRVFGFELPTAVIKTAVKGIIGIEKEKTSSDDYVVTAKQEVENVDFVSFRREAEEENAKLSTMLLDFARAHCSDQFILEDVLVQDFIAYLIDENSNTKNHDLISKFILCNAANTEIQESIEAIRQGVVLYTGLNYNISETGSLRKDLTLYLDTEILFNLSGYNGIVYQSIAEDFITLVRDANKGERKIKLCYFESVKEEIKRFFGTAEAIVEGKQLPNNKPAMKSIINGCQEAADVVEKMADFFLKLRTQFSITEDAVVSYYAASQDDYNLEGMTLNAIPQDEETIEALKYVSHINKLRKGEKFKEYTEAGYIFITETIRALEVSKAVVESLTTENESDSIRMCGFAQNMSGITNILWYKLNKGFGRKDYPQSLEAVLKAKVVLAKHISQKATRAYQELKQQYDKGDINKETMAARMIALREKNEKPEDISIDTVEDELDFSPEFYKKYEAAIEQNKTLLQDKEALIKELTERAEFERKQADKKIAMFQDVIEEQKKEQCLLKERISVQQKEIVDQKEMISELLKKEREREKKQTRRKNWSKLILKNVLYILLVVAVALITYIVCKIYRWDFGTILSIIISIVGLIPIAIGVVKNDYKKMIKDAENERIDIS